MSQPLERYNLRIACNNVCRFSLELDAMSTELSNFDIFAIITHLDNTVRDGDL